MIPARGPVATKRWWDEFGEQAAANGWDLAPGEARCLAINVHVGRTTDEARRTGRDPHDEWIKFLSPYGRFQGYAMPDGSKPPFDHQPPLETRSTSR